MRLIYLGARRSATFTNSDFHGLDVSQPIQISITLGQLDDPLKNIDSYGDYLVGFNVATGKIEPEPGYRPRACPQLAADGAGGPRARVDARLSTRPGNGPHAQPGLGRQGAHRAGMRVRPGTAT